MNAVYTQYGWETLTPTHRSPRRILHNVELAWYEYNAAVNRYMDGRGTQAEIDRLAELAEAADDANHRCTCLDGDDLCPSCQLFFAPCEHKHTALQGTYRFTDGEPWDDIAEVCIDCGATLN